jgi:ABC-type transport system substrate-binding protein
MLTGKSENTDIYIRIDDKEYLISPTQNSKPFTVPNFTQDWVEVKLKDTSNTQVSLIAYRYFNSERRLYQALLLNQVDFAILSDEALAQEVGRNNPNMIPAPISKKSHTIELIVYNLNHEILKNIEIRQAISYAIRKKNLVEQVINGLQKKIGEVAKGSVYEPDNELYPDVGIDEYRYNKRKARDLLENNGWRDRDNDGIREKNGKKLRINLAYRGGIELDERIVRDILLACNHIGIEINGVALSNRELKESLAKNEYEAVLWEQTFEENIDAIYDFFTNPKTSFIKFRNKQYERLYGFAKRSQSRERIVALAQGLQSTLNKNSVVSFLFFKWYDYAIINTAKVENVRDLSSGRINPVNLWRFTRTGK